MRYVALLCLLVLAACNSLNDNQQMGLATEANRPITCASGSDCEVKWARALQWVHTNSTYAVESQSDNLIQTETPSTVSIKSGFTITRQDAGKSMYIINFAASCGALAVCTPSSLELKAGFVTYVVDGPGQPIQ